jgi:predicted RNase H-like HicB family nuclease
VEENVRSVEGYLREPYARVLTPDEESGTYTAEILEFPGCVAQGDTPEEAYQNLEEAAEGWILAALDLGQEIPPPSRTQGYGGRIALRLPRSLHRRAAQMAERDGTSLNQFLVSAIAERVGADTLYARIAQELDKRAARVTVISVPSPTEDIIYMDPRTSFGVNWNARSPGSVVTAVQTTPQFYGGKIRRYDPESTIRPLVFHGPEEEES